MLGRRDWFCVGFVVVWCTRWVGVGCSLTRVWCENGPNLYFIRFGDRRRSKLCPLSLLVLNWSPSTATVAIHSLCRVTIVKDCLPQDRLSALNVYACFVVCWTLSRQRDSHLCGIWACPCPAIIFWGRIICCSPLKHVCLPDKDFIVPASQPWPMCIGLRTR